MNIQEYLLMAVFQLVIVFGIFFILVYAGRFAYSKIRTHSSIENSRFFSLEEYLPEEEAVTIKQVFFLIMIIVFVVIILYTLFSWRHFSRVLLVLDIVVSLYLIINEDIGVFDNKLMFFLLIPFASLSYLIFNNDYLTLMGLFHVAVYAYFIKVYYEKFVEYTESNSLGITIMLLFLIVFVSFFITIVVEDVAPIDSLVMVSNAFTSNGYSILGHSALGKFNAIFLVWSGFILSGVGTATLTVAIVMKSADKEFDKLEEKIKRNRKR